MKQSSVRRHSKHNLGNRSSQEKAIVKITGFWLSCFLLYPWLKTWMLGKCLKRSDGLNNMQIMKHLTFAYCFCKIPFQLAYPPSTMSWWGVFKLKLRHILIKLSQDHKNIYYCVTLLNFKSHLNSFSIFTLYNYYQSFAIIECLQLTA